MSTEPLNITKVHLLAGMKAQLGVPVGKYAKGTGAFAFGGDAGIHPEHGKLIRGFKVDNDTIGEIVPSKENGNYVDYTHKKSAENQITFYGANDEVVIFLITSVPIHDHSSVVQGGPAYGTYFSDDEVAET